MEIWRTCALCGGGWDAKCTYRFYVVVCAPLRRPRRYVYDSVCLCVCVCRRRRRRRPSRVRCSRIVPRHACVCGHVVRGALPPMLCTPAGRAAAHSQEATHAANPPVSVVSVGEGQQIQHTWRDSIVHTVLSSWLPRLKTLKNAAKEEGGAVILHYYLDFLLRPHAARDIQL